MGIFDKKSEISRRELRESCRKTPSPSLRMSSYQRVAEIEKIFPERRFKSHISKSEVKKRLRELRREMYRVKSQKEKLALGRKIRYIEDLTGIRNY